MLVNKPDIIKLLARRSRVTQVEAADRLDIVVSGILRELRNGNQPAIPGLGSFRKMRNGQVAFEREEKRTNG